jgi:hypothetical protein
MRLISESAGQGNGYYEHIVCRLSGGIILVVMFAIMQSRYGTHFVMYE